MYLWAEAYLFLRNIGSKLFLGQFFCSPPMNINWSLLGGVSDECDTRRNMDTQPQVIGNSLIQVA